MKLSPVTHAEILDEGVIVTFADGRGCFLSSSAIHGAVMLAEDLPEFSVTQQHAMRCLPKSKG